jgi:DNA polymerase-3 subunit beta
MKLTIGREKLLNLLQRVVGVVEKRQTLAILGNVLLRAEGQTLELVATDLEMELTARGALEKPQASGMATAPARKLLDICRQLPEGAEIRLDAGEDRLLVQAGKSRFTLPTLPASGFPAFEPPVAEESIRIDAAALRVALDKTLFAMAQQDVRFYLNGMLWEVEGATFRTVASDGHRLALREIRLEQASESAGRQVILPRKGVMELHRLLADESGEVGVEFGSNGVRVAMTDGVFSVKLVDSKYPDYRRVIPSDLGRTIGLERDIFRTSLNRVAVMCQEKYKGMRFDFAQGQLTLTAGAEDEQAVDQVDADYDGQEFAVAYNGAYIVDAIGHCDDAIVRFSVADTTQACVIQEEGPGETEYGGVYVVMPLRL